MLDRPASRPTATYAGRALSPHQALSRALRPLLVLAVILVAAVAGYMIIERLDFLDALYMVVITLSTVGFGEVKHLSPEGRVLTICLIVAGIGTVGFTAGRLLEFVLEGHLRGFARRRRMQKTLRELSGHTIICGFGRVGHQIAEEFREHGVPFVVVDHNPEHVEELALTETPHIIGKTADDDVLEEAGIRRARSLVAAVDSDAENVFVTLTARGLNPSIFVVARASDLETERKLRRAGADRVVSPYVLSGRRMAAMVLSPVTVDFLDTMVKPGEMALSIEELRVRENSPVVGRTLLESQIRQKTGALVLAVRHAGGDFEFNPAYDYTIQAEDLLIVLGTKEQCDALGNAI